jgi:hypothetical protein
MPESIDLANDDHRESFFHIFQPSSSCPADLAKAGGLDLVEELDPPIK